MNDDSIAINIALNPPLFFQKEVIELSRSINIKEKSSLFVLDGKNIIPHVTLYLTKYFKKAELSNLLNALDKFCLKNKSILLILNRFNIKGEWVDISFKANTKIKKMHYNLLDIITRYNIQIPDLNLKKIKNRNQKDYMKRFGYKHSLEYFRPHVSITKLKNKTCIKGNYNDIKLSKMIKFNSFSIYKMGRYGTCTSEIKRYNINNI